MLRFLRALTSRHPARVHAAPPTRRHCGRCGRSFAPADDALPELYCWWCSTHHAAREDGAAHDLDRRE